MGVIKTFSSISDRIEKITINQEDFKVERGRVVTVGEFFANDSLARVTGSRFSELLRCPVGQLAVWPIFVLLLRNKIEIYY
jgi:hypothetical protein